MKVSKILTLTDVGKNNSHLAAIRIPASVVGSDVLPALSTDILNPKMDLLFYDENNKGWIFQYRYYNDKFFGKSSKQSHNEYRLSCVREFIKAYALDEGDTIWFSMDNHEIRRVGFVRKDVPEQNDDGIIHIRGGWKIYEY